MEMPVSPLPASSELPRSLCLCLAQPAVTKQRVTPAGPSDSERNETEVWRPGVLPPLRMLCVHHPRAYFLLLRPQVNADAAEQSHTVQVSGVCDTIVHPPGQWYRDTQTVSTCSWLKTSAPAGGLIKSFMLAGWSWGSLRCSGNP